MAHSNPPSHARQAHRVSETIEGKDTPLPAIETEIIWKKFLPVALSSVAKKLAWDAPKVKKFFAYFAEAESLLILVFAEDQCGKKACTLPLLASLGYAPISTFCSCY